MIEGEMFEGKLPEGKVFEGERFDGEMTPPPPPPQKKTLRKQGQNYLTSQTLHQKTALHYQDVHDESPPLSTSAE